MFENEANKQIQCDPTPTMYVSRGGSELAERNNVMLALQGFEAVVGQLVTAPTDEAASRISLISMLVNGKQPIAVNDAGKSALSLQSLAAIVADSFAAPTENNLVALSLQSISAITAQTAPTQTENSRASIALRSMLV